MPFQSEKQRKFLFARKPEVAKKFVEHSKGMAEGGPVDGVAIVKENSPVNDTVKACLSPGEAVISREDIPSLLKAVKKDKSGDLDKVKLDLVKSTEVLLKAPYKGEEKSPSGLPKQEKVELNPIQQILNNMINKDTHINFRVPTESGKQVPGIMYRHAFSEGGPVEEEKPTELSLQDRIITTLNNFHDTIKANRGDGVGELGDSEHGLKKMMMDKAKLRDLHKIKKNGDQSAK